MAIFPFTDVKPLTSGFSETIKDNVVKSENEIGPIKTRRRATADIKTYNINIMLTTTQKSTFDTFYQTTLQAGTLPFDWVDFWDDTTQEYYFDTPPTYSNLGGSIVNCSFVLKRVI